MASGLLGRTNRSFPPVWLSLRTPRNHGQVDALIGSALECGAPIDISTQPGLWGGHLRSQEVFLTCCSSRTYENATSDRHANDLMSADLIQTLSAIGREHIDIYFLRLRRAVEEFQISGVLEALEMARQEGNIRYLGLCCDGSAYGALAMWQFHDAFDVLLVPKNPCNHTAFDVLSPLARERRVGIVTSDPLEWQHGVRFTAFPGPWKLRNLCQSFYGLTVAQAVLAELADEHPVLVDVGSAAEVREAIEAPGKPRPEGLGAYLEPFIEAYADDAQWEELAAGDDPALRHAAARRSQ